VPTVVQAQVEVDRGRKGVILTRCGVKFTHGGVLSLSPNFSWVYVQATNATNRFNGFLPLGIRSVASVGSFRPNGADVREETVETVQVVTGNLSPNYKLGVNESRRRGPAPSPLLTTGYLPLRVETQATRGRQPPYSALGIAGVFF
jgi:hypothetical protein